MRRPSVMREHTWCFEFYPMTVHVRLCATLSSDHKCPLLQFSRLHRSTNLARARALLEIYYLILDLAVYVAFYSRK